METSITTPKGQIVVPKKLRAKYGIKPGTKVAFIEKDGELILKALNKNYFDSLAGWLPEKGDPISELMKEKKKEKSR
ncbi:MAG: AbrB/MazE/SpoVT family DNA-binding domain-containing protein [Ignavibacteria bacterium]